MSKPPGKCIFCQNVGDLTKQHIIPNRYHRMLRGDITSHQMWRGEPSYIMPGDPIVVTSRFEAEKQGHMLSRQKRNVCRTCNSGWIKRAEDAAAKPMTDLIQGETPRLTPEDLRNLATQAALIATMAEFLDDSDRHAVSQSERDVFFASKQQPPEWGVFIGRISAPNWYQRGRREPAKFRRGPQAAYDLQTVTVALERFLIHVVTFQPGVFPDFDPVAYASRLGLVSINIPVEEPIEWSNQRVLGDDDVELVSQAVKAGYAERRNSTDAGVRELLITCPATGRPIGTGFWMDEEAFGGAHIGMARITCPRCGGRHLWAKSDVINFGAPRGWSSPHTDPAASLSPKVVRGHPSLRGR